MVHAAPLCQAIENMKKPGIPIGNHFRILFPICAYLEYIQALME
jgi:hypothetical protein